MINEIFICLALFNMSNVTKQKNVCDNIDLIHQVSKEYKIDPILIVSILWEESRFRSGVKSSKGACGISQVIPKYTDLFAKLRNKYSRKESRDKACIKLSEARTGISYGAKAFSYWLHKYGKGNVSTGLCGYNAGFKCKGEAENGFENIAYKRGMFIYAPNVLKFYKKLKKKVKKVRKIKYKTDYFLVYLKKSLF
jgi:soluble lytic murein transglycosylase-like protein